jgi:hypothetical protein
MENVNQFKDRKQRHVCNVNFLRNSRDNLPRAVAYERFCAPHCPARNIQPSHRLWPAPKTSLVILACHDSVRVRHDFCVVHDLLCLGKCVPHRHRHDSLSHSNMGFHSIHGFEEKRS